MNPTATTGIVIIAMSAAVGVTLMVTQGGSLGLSLAVGGLVVGTIPLVLGLRAAARNAAPKRDAHLAQQLRSHRTPVPERQKSASGGEVDVEAIVGADTLSSDYVVSSAPTAMPGLAEVYAQIEAREIKGHLLVVGGPDRGKGCPISDQPITLGRASENSFQLLDTGVSSHQATVALLGGKPFITDGQSKNGTFVNHQRVATQELQSCDMIGFGATKILVTLPT